MADAAARPGWPYWFAAIVLIVFGTLTGFSIGLPFLVIGLALVVMAPFKRRTRIFLPLLVGLAGFFIGFALVAPMSCTTRESIEFRSSGGATSIAQAGTSCSNVLGIEYSGDGDYQPPLAPGLIAGLVVAIVLGATVALIQRDRPTTRMQPHAIGWAGVGAHALWTMFLAGLGLLSDGSLDPQWPTALLFVSLAGLPMVLAVLGLKNRPALLLTAGIACIPLSFISLAGATLPLLVPAVLYLIAYARS